MALDFAVTSGLRAAYADNPGSATAQYEVFKRSHLNTERVCSSEGLGFTPMVVEAVGGFWGPASKSIFTGIAKAKSMITGEPVDMLLGQLRQRLGVVLHRENARAIVKRSQVHSLTATSMLAAAVTLQAAGDG